MLESGLAALTAQANSVSGAKITLTRFELATELKSNWPPYLTEVRGSILYSGSLADMRFSGLSDDIVVVSFMVDRNQLEGVIGNMILYCSFEDVEYPFARVTPANNERNIKLQTSEAHFGMDYFVRVIMSIPDIVNRIDFTPIVNEEATFLDIPGYNMVPEPIETLHDHAVIHNNQRPDIGGRSTPLFNVNNVWYGVAQVLDIEDTNPSTVWSGGVGGDGYQYVKDQGRTY